MKLGNIITDEEIKLGKHFNVVKDRLNCIEGLPILIIGHSKTKELYGDDLDFMNRELDGVSWTFTEAEQRKYHLEDLDTFMDKCFISAIEGIHYVFVDPIQFTRAKIKKTIRKIQLLEDPIVYHHENDMVYIYGENLIFGVDLKLLKFLGINDKRVLARIKSLTKSFLDGGEILIEYRDYMERLRDEVKFIPFIYSISNDE